MKNREYLFDFYSIEDSWCPICQKDIMKENKYDKAPIIIDKGILVFFNNDEKFKFRLCSVCSEYYKLMSNNFEIVEKLKINIKEKYNLYEQFVFQSPLFILRRKNKNRLVKETKNKFKRIYKKISGWKFEDKQDGY